MVRRGMLTTDMAIQICSTIKGLQFDIRADSGTKLKNRMTGEIIYTPPTGQKLLLAKLDNWANFMHRHTEIDPLVRMAAAHYQFEAIHPFTDGNGRTILNLAAGGVYQIKVDASGHLSQVSDEFMILGTHMWTMVMTSDSASGNRMTQLVWGLAILSVLLLLLLILARRRSAP